MGLRISGTMGEMNQQRENKQLKTTNIVFPHRSHGSWNPGLLLVAHTSRGLITALWVRCLPAARLPVQAHSAE